MSVCWLCKHANNKEAITMKEFIVHSAQNVPVQAMATSISNHLRETLPMEENLPGCAEIATHIERHMLQPQVRVPCMLRNVIEVSESLREVVATRGEDDTPLVDVRAAALYLKSVSELMQLYKNTDPAKMLFGS
jgi:hypothetical protein